MANCTEMEVKVERGKWIEESRRSSAMGSGHNQGLATTPSRVHQLHDISYR